MKLFLPATGTALVLLSGLTMTLTAANAAYAADDRDVVHDERSAPAVSDFGNCIRTKWTEGNDECAPQAPVKETKVVRQARVQISQEERTVYFGFNKTALSPEAQEKLNSLADKLKSDSQVKDAHIVGFADRIGGTAYNEKLSEKRAENVRSYLISRGFVNASTTEVRWLGKSSPVTQCADNLSRPELIDCLQRDRRVEVEINYLPESK